MMGDIANLYVVAERLRLAPLELTGQRESHVCVIGEARWLLHPLAAVAFAALQQAARTAGIELAMVSAFRSFEQQLSIWNDKFLGRRSLLSRNGDVLDPLSLDESQRVEAILAWSALPGASRHHWGTDIDVIDKAAIPAGGRVQLVPGEYAADGWFATMDGWLSQHAAEYGFYRPYDLDRGGVQPEPWHLSFAPVAVTAQANLTVDLLAASLTAVPLEGRNTIFSQLPELHRRFVWSVAPAPDAALAAAALRS